MFGKIDTRQTKSGPKYDARWRHNGVQQKKTFDTRADAKKHLADLIAGRKGGVSETVEWMVGEFLALKEDAFRSGDIEFSTLRDYRSTLKHVLSDRAFAKCKLSNLSKPEVGAFFRRLAANRPDISRSMTARIRRVLGVVFGCACEEGWLSISPAVRKKRSARPEVDDDHDLKIPDKKQARAIMAAAMARSLRADVQFRLLFQGGLRPSEMLGLPVTSLTWLKDGRVRVRISQRAENYSGKIGRVKTEKSARDITLGKDAAARLKEYVLSIGSPKAGLLFGTKNGLGMGYRHFRKTTWNPTLGAAGLAERKEVRRCDRETMALEWRAAVFTPHHARHFAVSVLIEAGFAPKAIQAFAGHSTLKVTMDIYGHLFPDEGRELAMADALEQA